MQWKKCFILKKTIEQILNDNKAIEISSIDLKNKTSIADFMIVQVAIHQDIYKLYRKYC